MEEAEGRNPRREAEAQKGVEIGIGAAAERGGEGREGKRQWGEVFVIFVQRREEAAVFSRQVEELSGALNEKIHTISDLTDRMAQLGA